MCTVPILEEVAVMIAGKGYLFTDASYLKFRLTIKDIKPDLLVWQATRIASQFCYPLYD